MVRLLLLRHAKSDWGAPDLADHDRPLAERGRHDAPRIGAALRAGGHVPVRVLCSTALRARHTLDLVAGEMALEAAAEFLPEIYEGGPQQILDLARSANGGAQTLMMVGHNPAFHEAALALCGAGGEALRTAMEAKFPTCTFAVIDFPDGWSKVGWGAGCLVAFLRPRDLEAAQTGPKPA